MMKKIVYATLGAFLLTVSLSPAFAAGSGSSSGTSGSAAPVLKCKTGEVVKKVKVSGVWVKKCVPVASSLLPDEELYQQGRSLAKAGRYEEALVVLAAIKNQNDPRVLNYTGYSNRKAGRIDIGITYYRKALAIDPNFVLAREYLGEGYVAAGKIDLAQIELNEIKARAGVNSEEYKDLAKSIATGLPVAQ
ncbi:MAG: tetratricopeptide repeat protein [Aestuariivirga sp.]